MRVSLLIAAVALPMALGACHQEGPAERAGEKLDNAGHSITDAVDPPKGPAESAGRKVDRALGN